MRLHLRHFVRGLALAPAVLLLSGCSMIKMALGHRSSAHMPARQPVDVVYLNQNWSDGQRQWFYHSGQGTIVMPYKWFLALEQPSLKWWGTPGKFADSDYLAGFGFLPNGKGLDNPDGLPVGFAKDIVINPHTGEKSEVVGFTCAACHTGQLNYKGKGVRIDGGSSVADPAAFQAELGYAVAFTDKIPFRFDRFAKAVLGEGASSDDKRALKKQFDEFLKTGIKENQMDEAGNLYGAAGGFGRTDALGRIGNYVFGTELNNDNLRVANAPVKLPYLWYTSWFARVQYNNSILQPMTRNVGESLGVRALVNLTEKDKLYRSTVNIKNLWEMEKQLSGEQLFSGLQQPAWPAEIFGPIDQAKAHRGEALYKQHCERCHLPALNSPAIKDAQYWEDGLEGHKFLKLKTFALDDIGTDPHESADFAKRTADTGPAMGLGTVPAASGLNLVTVKVRDVKYDELGLTPEERMAWNGYRRDDASSDLVYRARPMGGVWAVPPYLHNGSVPNLYELLSPVEQRSKVFYTGRREYDPVKVGYDVSQLENGFTLDTSKTGNSNAGHEFANKPKGKGVLGPELSEADRWALIEYLKVLDDSSHPSTQKPAPPNPPSAKW